MLEMKAPERFMRGHSCNVDEVMLAIRQYWTHRPHASDTARGIAQVWLQQRYPLDLVQAALALLETRGELKTRRLSGGGEGGDTLYSAPERSGRLS
jgi:hypothetical protein